MAKTSMIEREKRRTKTVKKYAAKRARIKEQIREGSPGMASYKYTLSETDINDLVTFIREACCWKDDEPPLNPRYIAK